MPKDAEEAERLAAAKYPDMKNRAMARKLAAGECIDVGPYRQDDGTYLLPGHLRDTIESTEGDGVDLCDVSIEGWIWSVGLREDTGEIFAARDSRYYQAEGYQCLWLR